jgi:hypothetical protein
MFPSIRSSKHIRMTEMQEHSKRFERDMPAGRFAGAVFRALFFSNFGIVSDFEIRISDLFRISEFGFRVFGLSMESNQHTGGLR